MSAGLLVTLVFFGGMAIGYCVGVEDARWRRKQDRQLSTENSDKREALSGASHLSQSQTR